MKCKRFLILILICGLYSIFPQTVFSAVQDSSSEDCLIDGLESYLSRPKILAIKPQAHPSAESWDKMKWAHLEAVAQLIYMYPDHQIYFLARDAELLYDLALLMTEGDPKTRLRLHLLNVSRSNLSDPKLKEYLAQKGITASEFQKGQKVLFVDTGFSGSISRRIQQLYSSMYKPLIQTHLVISNNLSHPSSRVFLSMLNSDAAKLSPALLIRELLQYESMPRYFDRSTGFRYQDGLLHPVSPRGSQTDGKVSKETAKKFMQDLAAFAQTDDAKERFREIGETWRELYYLASWGQKNLLLEKLALLLNRKDPFSEALVKDFIEIINLNRPHARSKTVKSFLTLRYVISDKKTGHRFNIEFSRDEVDSIKTKNSSDEVNQKLKILAQSENRNIANKPDSLISTAKKQYPNLSSQVHFQVEERFRKNYPVTITLEEVIVQSLRMQ